MLTNFRLPGTIAGIAHVQSCNKNRLRAIDALTVEVCCVRELLLKLLLCKWGDAMLACESLARANLLVMSKFISYV